jgi:hypothetical protein
MVRRWGAWVVEVPGILKRAMMTAIRSNQTSTGLAFMRGPFLLSSGWSF